MFDVGTGTIRRLGQRLVAPLWLGPELIAATEAVPCPPDDFCVVPWVTRDRTVGIDVDTGERRQLQLLTTLQDPFFYGAIDTSLDTPAR